MIRQNLMSSRALLLSGITLGASVTPTLATKSKQPNIIFILTDDQKVDAMGFAGNPIIETPQMDRLAKNGVYFKNAFSTTPISAASRASILTGLHERTHGYTFQQGNLKNAYCQTIYPKILKENGYQTAFFGKLGVQINQPEQYFSESEFYDRNDRFKDRRGYYYKTIGKDTVHLTHYTGYKAQEYIKKSSSEQPFCLSICFSAPHAHDSAKEQYFWDAKSDHRYANTTIPDPIMAEDDYFLRLPKEVQEGFNRTRWHWRFDSPEKYQAMMKGYYRMISEVDDEIGAIRQTLREKGIEENTIIILMGDNGYFTGERQLADKWLMYEPSIRIPLVIFDPRVKKNAIIDAMVLNIDVPSTVLSMAGVKIPKNYQGMDLSKFIEKGNISSHRKSILLEHLWKLPQIPSSEAIRTNQWKYMRYRLIEAPEELYDLSQDPQEKKNLALDPTYRPVLLKLRKELEKQTNKYNRAKLVADEPFEGVKGGF